MENMKFAVLGGDKRAIELCNQLSYSNNKVFAFGFDQTVTFAPDITICNDIETQLDKCDIIIFPLPVSKDKVNLFAPFSPGKTFAISSIFAKIQNAKAIFGGKVSLSILETAKEYNLEIHDYLEREEFAILNAVPTAEGAIQIAMEELLYTIANSNCLLTGYGRISKVLGKILIAMGANVSVTARKFDQLTWAKVEGCNSFHLKNLHAHIGDFDIIFNTVPFVILTETMLKSTNPNCLIIDLASLPGGVDFAAASKLGIRAISAQSLPGKVAPITSGKIIMDTVLNMCEELMI